MTALTVDAAAAPQLRRLPVPATAPQPALRLVRDDEHVPLPRATPTPSPSTPSPSTPSPSDPLPPAPAAEPGAGPSAGPSAEALAELLRQEAYAVEQFCAPRPTPSRALPDPTRWTAQFVQAAIEVAAGFRSPQQLVRWSSEDVHATLTRRGALAQRLTPRAPGTPARVHSVRVSAPRDGACEASAVVADRGRVRAVALRLEGLDGRWQVTALEIG